LGAACFGTSEKVVATGCVVVVVGRFVRLSGTRGEKAKAEMNGIMSAIHPRPLYRHL
jgi:hypothetical protein